MIKGLTRPTSAMKKYVHVFSKLQHFIDFATHFVSQMLQASTAFFSHSL